jgi:uncharacterized protein (DUF1800 family)
LDSPEPPGDWVNEPAPQWDALTDEEVMALFEQYFEWMWEMANWWLIRMTRNELNIRETMTLFWHNYFATAQSKVEYPQAMYQQNTVFREYGLGNFKELLRRVTFGPAMIIWLDIHRSNKDAPNENFARELLELFTMGASLLLRWISSQIIMAGPKVTRRNNSLKLPKPYSLKTVFCWYMACGYSTFD